LLLRKARKLARVLLLGAFVAGIITVPAAMATAAPTTPAKSVQQQIDDASNKLEVIVEQYDKINTELAADKATEATLRKQMQPTLDAVNAAQGKVSLIATQAYMTGPSNPLAVIVSSSNASDLIDQMSAINEVADNQAKQIASYAQVTAQYYAQKQKIDALIALQTSQKAMLAAQKATINTNLTKLYAMRVAAYGSATTASGGSTPIPPYIPGRGGVVVKFAYAQLGKPYVWAAAGPNSYDCSGLVLAAYKQVGINLPHNAAMQWGVVHHIPRAELSPGDLVFYDSSNIHHVAIYIGNNEVIHAPTFGDHVKISGVNMMIPWGYGRP
jgi:cell wall-associated NlpC family hydrolase